MTSPDETTLTRLSRVFDAETFRSQGHAVVDLLADYLAHALQGGPMPVLPATAPDEMLTRWPDGFPEEPSSDLLAILGRVVEEANHLHHPHHFGHQVASPLPGVALCELVAGLLNNGMAVYEHGPSGTAMERHVIQWMADSLGMGRNADGILTSGGSAGNLTAMLAMRQATADWDVWAEGSHRGAPAAVLVSEQAHYSVGRAIRIMGWGDGGVVPVAVDERLRIRPDALDEAHRRAEADGRRPVAVAANACCTPTGAYDPLEPIADYCAKRNLWLHVDGAHGAAACLSPQYRRLVRGIERADSVVWDAHKMLLIPALCTGVIFRRGADSYAAFAQKASYLFDHDPQEEWYNLGQRTLECTKRMLSLKVYAALMCYGTRAFSDYVTRMFDLGRAFGRIIEEAPDFELGAQPESNIVCFRHVPEGATDVDGLQAEVRKRVLQREAFYLVQARLPKGQFLRGALMNPFIDKPHMHALLDEIREVAACL